MRMMRRTSAYMIAIVAIVCCYSILLADDGENRARPSDLVVYKIKPSTTDSAIRHFNEPHFVIVDQSQRSGSQLVVFLPGTDGRPSDTLDLLRVVARLGYRVIGLQYNDSPAVIQVCPNKPPNCAGDFRRKRISGEGVSDVVDNTIAESINSRLVKLLQYLDQTYPTASWSEYLRGGTPEWSKIIVAGLSQGAGMAAYIAQRESVARVVLFSGPWDYSRDSRSLAPWISEPSVTPPERWFAEYHRRENTAEIIAQTYAVLRIPVEHLKVFDLELPAGYRTLSHNPYHGSTVLMAKYEPEWRFLFGSSTN